MNKGDGFADRLAQVRLRLDKAARRAGRDPRSVTLVAVTKTVPVERIHEAYWAGIRHFGENRVQEALSKIPHLPPDVSWHLLGPLQKNKIRKAIGRFRLWQALDSLEIARAFAERLTEGRQDVLLEVNIARAPKRAGFPPEQLPEAIAVLQKEKKFRLRGLMAMAPYPAEEKEVRAAFREARKLFEDGAKLTPPSDWTILSMGMSSDFEWAVEEGATMVRIGSFLFGERPGKERG